MKVLDLLTWSEFQYNLSTYICCRRTGKNAGLYSRGSCLELQSDPLLMEYGMNIIWSSLPSFLYSFRVLASFWPPCSYPRLTYPESSCLLFVCMFVSAFFSFLSSCLSLFFSVFPIYPLFPSISLSFLLSVHSSLLVAGSLQWQWDIACHTFRLCNAQTEKYESLKRLMEALTANNAVP
jgi:hypothetical protein